MRRKLGPDISTWRVCADGSLGSAVPCVLCRKQLVRYGFRLNCAVGQQLVWRGSLSDGAAPASKLTSQQRLAIVCKAATHVNHAKQR